jgi:uncharacterized membrane protein (UPF0136 family)
MCVRRYLIQQNANNGHELAFGTSAVLTVAMFRRALKSKAKVPTGLAVLGAANLVFNAKKIYEYRYGL